jgi:perosamine synthetase
MSTPIDPTGSVVELLANLNPPPTSLHEPEFFGNEWKYAKDCLDTGWVSSVGSYVDRFEEMLADYTGAKYAIATNNGTASLHICLLLAGVMPDEEVLMPALTFVATANAVSYCHAHPHFIDCEEATLGLDPDKLSTYLEEIADVSDKGCFNKKTGRRIAAIICMHAFGHPAKLDGLLSICERFQLPLIEDAAESLGSKYKGKHTGTLGLISALSFNGNKIMTTGGGGAILTNDAALAKQAKHLITTAKVAHKWEFDHDQVGFNYRMPNVNAAIGCAQLEQLPSFLTRKRILAERYKNAFDSVDAVEFFQEPQDSTSNYWLNVLLLETGLEDFRDRLLEKTNDQGIMTRPAWTPMHMLKIYKDCPRMDLSITESLYRRLINIPSSPSLVKASDGQA